MGMQGVLEVLFVLMNNFAVFLGVLLLGLLGLLLPFLVTKLQIHL